MDAYGCHNNRKAGGYHCHRGPLAGQSFASKEEMLKKLSPEKVETDKKIKAKTVNFIPRSKRGRFVDSPAIATKALPVERISKAALTRGVLWRLREDITMKISELLGRRLKPEILVSLN